MKTVGIICEYNPFHLGHRKQIVKIREHFGADCRIVCLMSGNFVQRGQPAIFDKSLRAEAALRCGADLVLELPVNVSLSSAEGFAAGGVRILSEVCDVLCFGTESGEPETLMATAAALGSPAFSGALRQHLDRGLSFPAARAAALDDLNCGSSLLKNPNDILAVEYCKAILAQEAQMEIFPIFRQGSYHDRVPDGENPSATSLRERLLSGGEWKTFVPADAADLFSDAPLHTMQAGERAVLARLRTMADEEFEALPYGGEGLWRKLMQEARRGSSVEEILAATKSKRYTRTRLDRMCMCAFLGLNRDLMGQTQPYTRILGFTDRGRELLRSVKKEGSFRNAGEADTELWWSLEKRCGDLYGLFCVQSPDAPGTEERRRVRYIR